MCIHVHAWLQEETEEQQSAGKAAAAQQGVAGEAAGRLERDVLDARSAVSAARASLENEASRGAVVSGLMAAQERGEISGVFGRLGDLAAVEKKYDAAVSNGAGALDNILVDTTTNAQHCVEYLRRYAPAVCRIGMS